MSAEREGPQEAPAAPPWPGGVADAFKEALPDVEFVAAQGARDVVITVKREDVPRVLRAAKDDPRLDLKYLRCLCGVDQMEEGLEVVYQLYSLTKKHGLTLKTPLPQDDPHVASAASVWKGADWLERETAEMFGIVFDGHPNPVPILLPEDMTDHHPLRKDNPLQQIEEWQGLRLGPEVANAGHFPPGYEGLAAKAESSEGDE